MARLTMVQASFEYGNVNHGTSYSFEYGNVNHGTS